MSKYIDMIGWDDAPHLQPPHITKEELDDLESSMLPHQRAARRKGRPSLGAGAIYPINEETILIDPFKIPDHYERGYALDVGWRRTAALFGAHDADADIYYLTHEYYEGEKQPILHAHTIKAMMAWPKQQGCIDPAAEHSNQKDGEKLKIEYESLGLELIFANNAREAGIVHVLNLMQGGQLKVFNTLKYWLKEFRLYRRNEKGKIIKENDHLMDDTRYLFMTPNLFETKPMQSARNRGYGEW